MDANKHSASFVCSEHCNITSVWQHKRGTRTKKHTMVHNRSSEARLAARFNETSREIEEPDTTEVRTASMLHSVALFVCSVDVLESSENTYVPRITLEDNVPASVDRIRCLLTRPDGCTDARCGGLDGMFAGDLRTCPMVECAIGRARRILDPGRSDLCDAWVGRLSNEIESTSQHDAPVIPTSTCSTLALTFPAISVPRVSLLLLLFASLSQPDQCSIASSRFVYNF